jgi:hypothetical protein
MILENFFFHSHASFSPPKNSTLSLILSPKFRFLFIKVCDIETGVSTVYFSENTKKLLKIFQIFQKKRF